MAKKPAAKKKPARKPAARKPSTRKVVWRPVFLDALTRTGNVAAACQAANTSRQTAYKARSTDKTFAAAWLEALEVAIELLEAEARRRAMTISDTLLIFLLKAHKPSMYRDKVNLQFFTAQAADIAAEYDLEPADVLAEAERMLANGA